MATLPMSQAQLNLEQRSTVPFYKIVLTGGPCGGKTTALARVSSYLRERGFEVCMCPEVFTILHSNGMSLEYLAVQGMDVVIQTTVLQVIESMEDGMEIILRATGKPSVLLCDRGIMDGLAYMEQARFEGILKSKGKEICDVREGRYNAIFHMVSAAEGAEPFYSLENNGARSESVEQAREVDRKIQRCWAGHPYLVVLDNSTDFEGKLQRLVEGMAKLVGLPTNLTRHSAKFLLSAKPDLDKFTVDYHVFEVEKVYLLSQDLPQTTESGSTVMADEYTFIRRRSNISKDGTLLSGSAYGFTVVQKTADGQIIEKKRIITSREFSSAMKQRDLSRHIVKQRRIAFLYNHQSFNIHVRQMALFYLIPMLHLICILIFLFSCLLGIRRTNLGFVYFACAGGNGQRRRTGSDPPSVSGNRSSHQQDKSG